MRRGSARAAAGALLLAVLAATPVVGGTEIRALEGRIEARTGHEVAVLGRGETARIDELGRIHRAGETGRRPGPGRVTGTLLVVLDGALRLDGGGVLSAGQEIFAGGTIARPAWRSVDLLRSEALRAAFGFSPVSSRPGVRSRDQQGVTRLVTMAIERLERLDVEGLLDLTNPAARLGGRPYRDHARFFERIRAGLSHLQVSFVLQDLEPAGSRALRGTFVMSVDFFPRALAGRSVNFAGSGTISFERTGPRWVISDGDIRAFDVDTDELPTEFVELRDLWRGGAGGE